MRKLIVLLLCWGLGGCAAVIPLPDKPIINTRIFEASYVRVWDATLQSLTNSGEAITVAQKESCLVNFQRKIPLCMLRGVALAPKGVCALSNHWVIVFPYAQINLIVKQSDDSHTLVTINAKIVGDFGKPWTTFRAQELASNGVLEKEYLDRIQVSLMRDKSAKDSK